MLENNNQNRLGFGDDVTIGRDVIGGDSNVVTFNHTEILQISVETITNRKLIKTSPYKGLKRFNFKDRDHFFGRDRLIARLLKAVNKKSLSLVLGASGSGKSSLVRAGLIPEFKKSLKSQTFYDFIFTPNQDPFESLYWCLLNEEKDYSFSKAEAKIALKAKTDTLTELISTLRKDGEQWLIVVDQFEELFTICDNPDKRKNFIEGIVQVANAKDTSVKIVLAMRADFLEQLSSYPDLGVIANQNNIHLVTDMHPDELRQAIEQPAARHGVVFEKGLVEQIIKEVEGQKGYLPLLQYTLNLLWQSECKTIGADGFPEIEDRTLNKTSYAALEGVRGALQKQVNEIYDRLNQDEQSATKQIFVKLVNIVDTDSGSKTVSRRANRSEFVGESIEKILNRFVEEKLLVSSSAYSSSQQLKITASKSLEQSATVEIAHEILLSSWNLLKSWLEQEKEAIILKNWLTEETKRWQKIRSEDESKARKELLKGSILEQVVEFRKKEAFKNVGGLRPEEEQFIDVSMTETERLEKEKEEQRQRELEYERKARQAAQKRTLRILITAPILTILLILLGNSWRATQIEKIRSLSATSKAFVFSNQAFNALNTSLQATTKFKQPIFPPSKLQKEVSQTIQQALVEDAQEYNRIEERTGDITSVQLSPDSKMIATASDDGTVKLWSIDGKELKPLPTLPHDEEVTRVIFSPDDGQTIATVTTDATKRTSKMITLWSKDGQKLKTIAFNGFPENVIFSPDGQMIATVGDNYTVTLWSKNGEKLKPIPNNSFVMNVSFSPDSKIMAIVDGETVKFWSKDGDRLKPLQHYGVKKVSFSSNSQMIATASYDGTVKLWSIDGEARQTLPHDAVYDVNLSPDGQKIVTQDAEGVVRLWSIDDGNPQKILDHDKAVTIVRFSPDKKTIATVGKDKIVKLWDDNGKLLKTLTGHQSKINSISFSPDGKTITTTSNDKTVKLWSIDGQELQTLQHYNLVKDASFSLDGKTIVSVSQDNTVRFWSLDNLKFQTLQGHQEPVNLVRFSPDGQTIAIGRSDGDVEIWSREGQQLKRLVAHEGRVNHISFSPDGKTIATAGQDRTVKVWNIENKELKTTLTGHKDSVLNVSFSPDGKTITSVSRDGEIKRWNSDGKEPKTIKYNNLFESVSFSPNNKMIATTSGDNTVQLWSHDGQELETLKGHDDKIMSLSFSPDGKTLATASRDNSVILWNLDFDRWESILDKNLDELVVDACQVVGDYLKNQPEQNDNPCDRLP